MCTGLSIFPSVSVFVHRTLRLDRQMAGLTPAKLAELRKIKKVKEETQTLMNSIHLLIGVFFG